MPNANIPIFIWVVIAVILIPLAAIAIAIVIPLFPIVCTIFCTFCSDNRGFADYCDDERRSSDNILDYSCCSIPNLMRAFYTEDENETHHTMFCFYHTDNGCLYGWGRIWGKVFGYTFSVMISFNTTI